MELKKFRRKDISDVLAWIKDESQLMQWAGPIFTWPLTKKQFAAHLKAADSDLPTLYPFGFYKNSKLIGYCELAGFSRNNDSATLARVILSPKYRGKGLSELMLTQLLQFGFADLALHRISLGVFDFNKPAIRCYKKLGFKLEGTLRESAKVQCRYWNCHIMSVLKKEQKPCEKKRKTNNRSF